MLRCGAASSPPSSSHRRLARSIVRRLRCLRDVRCEATLDTARAAALSYPTGVPRPQLVHPYGVVITVHPPPALRFRICRKGLRQHLPRLSCRHCRCRLSLWRRPFSCSLLVRSRHLFHLEFSLLLNAVSYSQYMSSNCKVRWISQIAYHNMNMSKCAKKSPFDSSIEARRPPS